MKKIGKAKKTKLVESAKTVIIVLLFLSCIFFFSRIFETYREQTTGDSLWGQKNSNNFSQTLTSATKEGLVNDFVKLSEPVEIILNCGQGRKIIPQPSDEFNMLSLASARLIKDGYSLSSDEVFNCDFREWEDALNKDSVYIKYPQNRSVWFEAEIYQSKGYILDVLKGYDEILILPGKSDDSIVFLRDRQEDNIIKIRVINPETKTVKNVLEKYQDALEKDCVFACEIGLDESNDGAALESMMMLLGNESMAHEILINITRNYKLGLNFTKSTEFASGLISIFGYNPNTVRQYVSNDDSLIFVGETGSLSVHPEGKIEYKALDANEGILLTSDGQQPTTILSGLTGIIERIFEVSGVGKESRDFDIKFTKMPQNIENSQRFELCFDYFVDGKKLIFSDVPAIYAVVDRGVLVELKIEVRDIQKLENKSQLESIDIDNFKMENPKPQAIIDVQSVYRCTKNDEKIKATWEISSAR